MQEKNRTNRRKIKEEKTIITPSEEKNEIIKFIKILGLVLLVVVAGYFFTRLLVLSNQQPPIPEPERPIQIDHNVVALGAMFTRPYDEYYVFIYRSDHNQAALFEVITANFRDAEDSIKIYHADLASPFNQAFHGEESNPHATSAHDLVVGDVTLIKIRNGRIVRFLENIDEIISELEVSR